MTNDSKKFEFITNETIRRLVIAFETADWTVMEQLIDKDVRWVEMEGGPFGGVYLGLDAVTKLFGDAADEYSKWDNYHVPIDECFVIERDEDTVVLLRGSYNGFYRETQKQLRAAFVHYFRVRNEKIVEFVQFADTAKLNAVYSKDQ